MKKNIINNINLSRVTYYLEIIKNKDLAKKVKAFKKLDSMVISKEMGLLILDYAKINYGIKDGNGGISSSLISFAKRKMSDAYLSLPRCKNLLYIR